MRNPLPILPLALVVTAALAATGCGKTTTPPESAATAPAPEAAVAEMAPETATDRGCSGSRGP